MAGRFESTVVIDRPIEEVFAFLADGETDPKFSPPVLEITKTTEGPPGIGTVYTSTVKDAGVKTKREFKLTEFEPPTRIRWTEVSKNLVSAPEGTYDLAPEVRKEIERLRDRNVVDTRSHVPDQHRASMASLRQRNMLLLAENRRLPDQVAELKAELAIACGHRRVRQMNFDSPAPSPRMAPTAAQRTQSGGHVGRSPTEAGATPQPIAPPGDAWCSSNSIARGRSGSRLSPLPQGGSAASGGPAARCAASCRPSGSPTA